MQRGGVSTHVDYGELQPQQTIARAHSRLARGLRSSLIHIRRDSILVIIGDVL